MDELHQVLRRKVDEKRRSLTRAIEHAVGHGAADHVTALRAELEQLESWIADGWEALSEMTAARLCAWLDEPTPGLSHHRPDHPPC